MTTLTGPPKPDEAKVIHRAAKMDAAFNRLALTAIFTMALTAAGHFLAARAWHADVPIVPVWLVFWGFVEAVVHTVRRAAHAWYGVANQTVQPRVTITAAEAVEFGKTGQLVKDVNDAA